MRSRLDACTLVQIRPDGKENQVTAMPALHGWRATFTPVADFNYRVETGADSSPSYSMETVQLVDLAADSPEREITAKPPVYAENTVDAEITDGLAGRGRAATRHGSL